MVATLTRTGSESVYITLRKYKLKTDIETVFERVSADLIPILKESPGFEGYWSVMCDDGAIAGISIFDSEAHSDAAHEKTMGWVNEHIRELVILPPESMFGGVLRKVA